jgi:indole-3-glycerol phosphate synthase
MDDLIAARRKALMQRKAKTPLEAIRALASMQKRPLPVLSTVTDAGDTTMLVGHICYKSLPDDAYDPVALAMRFIREGMDAVNLFTDDHESGLSDLALVARGGRFPVIYEDVVFDEYQVVEARAAGASALLLSSSAVDESMLRVLVSATQRNRMTAIVHVEDDDQLRHALSLGVQAVALGEHDALTVSRSVDHLSQLRSQIPLHTHVMICCVLETLEDVAAVASLCPDAVLVGASMLARERAAEKVRQMLACAQEQSS